MTMHNQNRHIHFSDGTCGMEKGITIVAQNAVGFLHLTVMPGMRAHQAQNSKQQ